MEDKTEKLENVKRDKGIQLRYLFFSILFVLATVLAYRYSAVFGVLMTAVLLVFVVVYKRPVLDSRRLLEKKVPSVLENTVTLSNIRILGRTVFPFALLDREGNITASNGLFQELFGDYQIIAGQKAENVLKNYDCLRERQQISAGEKTFEVYTEKCDILDEKNHTNREAYCLSMVDITELNRLERKLTEEKTVVALIYIDNYEEVLESIDETSIPLLTALIDRKLNSLASSVGGVVKKFEKDRYVFLLSMGMLEVIKEKKFDILNEVKEINIGEHIPVTLSIGIGVCGESLEEAMKSAKAAIDLALGRGGDQVLIKEGEKYLFYGGKSGEISHNARIRARVKADALSELMAESSQVLVMGHRTADLDSLGSCIGIYKISQTMGKECHIILNKVSVGVKRLHDRMMATGDYGGLFISDEEALDKLTDSTLVVITDTHRESIVESPEVLERANKVVLFDHHRKSTDFIEKAVLIYHEPYASSTCELVTEVIQYIGEKIKLRPVEADALLGGITVDTKSFCVKTGAITFEAAAFLRRNGADSTRVRLLFQNDMAAYKAKATAVRDAELFEKNMAISVCPSDVENSTLTAAQAADDLLNVTGIQASFVLCGIEDVIYVSARSLGDINVQVIMEKLGGGGHQTVSGVQLKGISLLEAKEKVKEAVKEYLQEVE